MSNIYLKEPLSLLVLYNGYKLVVGLFEKPMESRIVVAQLGRHFKMMFIFCLFEFIFTGDFEFF